jgi:hypothetical protein
VRVEEGNTDSQLNTDYRDKERHKKIKSGKRKTVITSGHELLHIGAPGTSSLKCGILTDMGNM